ncbi:response regulator [Oscillatoria sp. FACHB-1406]|uniref:response regulator n=1 Tax=Oscillatoria sp. FACHB-1406 TaxID=2692846 RepID=UPI00168553A7|nr:response regulator [Oscillatoria sp. FACHB-1406]MBD2576963.1 response regulator [Oscillatoria sp. FACHB-1406]
MRLLLVEDDELLAQTLSTALSAQNYVVDVAVDGEEGWNFAQAFTYDLILLDVSLPRLDGIALCRRLRKQDYNNPILLLTAKDSSEDKIAGLDAGADDYMVKPCTVSELFARLRALLRRRSASGAPVLEWDALRLDPVAHEVMWEEQLLSLSPKEYSLLELFLRNPRRVFSKQAILEHLWSFDDPPSEETIRAHIKGLRRKLKQVGAEEAIETVYGIGYRLKPSPEKQTPVAQPDRPSPEEVTRERAASNRAEDAARERTLAAVRKVWERFRGPIMERIAAVDEAIAALQSGTLSEELRAKAEQQAHKLAGSLGMYGFNEGSHLAREIEQALEGLSVREPVSTSLASNLKALAAQLRHELEQSPQVPEAASSELEVRTLPSVQTNAPFKLMPTANAPLLLVVDDDPSLTDQLEQESLHWDVQVQVAADIPHARAAIARQRPDAILLDLAFPEAHSEGLELLEELSEHQPNLPVIVFTRRDGFDDRVSVARLGGRAFLAKPVSPSQVFETAIDVMKRTRTPEAKVLATDDDPILLAAIEQFLDPWGIELHTLSDPRLFWETLEATAPDLLILDVDMPEINGIELCQVVRNDRTWQGLPIIFLTARRDPRTIQRIYEAGADDYVPKPVTEPELVTRIVNRLERTRLLRNIAETDTLTGVANRYRSQQEFNRYLRLARRYNQPLTLAAIDLDHFKNINDRYGHATGDRVLQRLGQLLRLTFKSEDIVSRWGGEEFIVGMYGLTQPEGIQRLDALLVAMRAEIFLVAEQEPLRVTFSGGVAEYPKHGIDLQKLYLSADAALYQAKKAGRNRIIGFSSH